MRAQLAGLLAVAVLATGCAGGQEDGPPPVEPAAEALADAITTGDFSRVEVSGNADPTGEMATIFEGMHGLHPQVEIGDVNSYPESATVKLNTTWGLSAPWTYQTEATFTLVNDTWQVHWSPALVNPRLTEDNRLERTTEPSARGGIVGADGYGLTETGPAQLIGIDTAAPNVPLEDSARRLAELVSINTEAYIKEVTERPDQFVVAKAVRADSVPPELEEIPGAKGEPVSMPVPPSSSSAAAVTGRLGTASPQEATTSAGKLAPGSVVGRSGVQKSRDAQLRGMGATRVYLVPRDQPVGEIDTDNNELLADYPTSEGQEITTTIDGPIQDSVDQTLAQEENPTSVVAIRPMTGEILAAGDTSGAARANRDSMNEPFAPEAAGAPIGALALMRSGADLSAEVQCEDELNVEGRIIEESDLSRSSTETTLDEAIADGCTTALASQHPQVDAAALTGAASSLGMGVQHDIGVETSFGQIEPGPTGGDVAEALAGRGGIHTTPVGLASMAASIKSGYIIVPWVMDDTKPFPHGQPPLAPNEAEAMRELMESGASGAASGISGADGALVGYADNRLWAVGYSDEVAFAAVTYSESPSTSQIADIAESVTQAASESSSSDSSSDSSSSDD